MCAFEKIVGYEPIKKELRQLCDMIKNQDIYKALGAKQSRGLLISGAPGLGKSLMVKCFIEESGRKAYTLRRNKPDGDFVNEVRETFNKAKENAPSIVFLDDMDKFVVEDNSKEEYVTIQACIDEVATDDVYVIATANSLREIPDSLLRAGRFDRKIEVEKPCGQDSIDIIKHYMKSKKFVVDVNVDDIAKMLNGKSCAELETILNEAAVAAGYERAENITTEHIVNAVLRMEYNIVMSSCDMDEEKKRAVAYHEAGHAAIIELSHRGGVGIVSLCERERYGKNGFVIEYEDIGKENRILCNVAGRISSELFAGVTDRGAGEDLSKALYLIKSDVVYYGLEGYDKLDVFERYEYPSAELRARQESAAHAMLGEYIRKATEILCNNKELVHSIANALLEKGTLLNSDIARIREQLENQGAGI